MCLSEMYTPASCFGLVTIKGMGNWKRAGAGPHEGLLGMYDKFNAHQHLPHQDFTCSRLFTGVFDLLKSGSSSSHAGPGLPASRKAASFPVQHHFIIQLYTSISPSPSERVSTPTKQPESAETPRVPPACPPSRISSPKVHERQMPRGRRRTLRSRGCRERSRF